MIVIRCILFMLFISIHQCRLPDKVFCVNEACNEPISRAKTVMNYNSGDRDLISFRGNAEALIFMKSAGTEPDLWYVTINGKSGFVSSKFLRENKIFVKEPAFILPVEIRDKKKDKPDVQPDKVQQAHEVFEGTTIYTTESTADTPEVTSEGSPVEASTPALDAVDISTGDPTDLPPIADENSVQNIPSSQAETVAEESHEEFYDEDEEEELIPAPVNENSAEVIPDVTNELSQEADQPQPNDLPAEHDSVPTEPQVATPKTPQEIVPSDVKIVPEVLEVTPEKMKLTPDALSEPIFSEIEEHNIPTPSNIVEDSNIDTTSKHVPSETQVPETHQNIDEIVDQTVNQVPEEPSENLKENIIIGEEPNVKTYEATDENQFEKDLNEYLAQKPVTENLEVTDSQEKLTTPYMETTPQYVESITTHTEPTTPPTIQAIPPSTLYEPRIQSDHSSSSTDSENIIDPYSASISPPIQDISSSSNEIHSLPPLETFSSSETTTETPVTLPYTSAESESYTSIDPLTDSAVNIATETTEYTTTSEENSSSLLESIYTTVSDMWPSTTEAPITPEIPGDPPMPDSFPKESYQDKIVSENGSAEEGFTFIKYLTTFYLSVWGVNEQSKALFPTIGETCFSNEYSCEDNTSKNNRLLTFLVTTASSLLLFTLGYYYIDTKRQDGKLVGMVNSLQRDLLCSTKECEILKEELTSTKNKLTGIEDNSFGMDDMVQSLKEEILEMKAQNERLRNSLDDNEKLLRVSENTAGELQNTLGEVENTLSELLAERAVSEEQIAELNGKIQAFEEELISVSRDRDSFQLKYVSAESALEESKNQKKLLDELNQQMAEAKNVIELQKHEIAALKDALKDMKGGGSNVDVSSLIDHTEIKAKLSKALEEKEALDRKYNAEHKENVRLAEQLNSSQESLRTSSQHATEAVTRLEVLGKYFQEREGELMKEISSKEALYLSKQGESASTVEKIELLQQEVQRFKEKCDSLTLELAEKESAKRTTIAELEARAHAAWLEARAAKRDAAADKEAAAALRRKLAAMGTAPAADGTASPLHRISSPLDSSATDGSGAVVPPPLPPLAFLPPLLPPLPRPPPLGRLPSPHPPRYERRYSPDSRYSPESRYSPQSRYSPETVRYSPDSRYSPPRDRSRRSPYSPRSRRRSRSRSRERYQEGRGSRQRNGPSAKPKTETETEYASDSPTRSPRRRRYSRHSGPSSGSGCSSSESEK